MNLMVTRDLEISSKYKYCYITKIAYYSVLLNYKKLNFYRNQVLNAQPSHAI